MAPQTWLLIVGIPLGLLLLAFGVIGARLVLLRLERWLIAKWARALQKHIQRVPSYEGCVVTVEGDPPHPVARINDVTVHIFEESPELSDVDALRSGLGTSTVLARPTITLRFEQPPDKAPFSLPIGIRPRHKALARVICRFIEQREEVAVGVYSERGPARPFRIDAG